ncbi:MAG: hypothetical protein KME64_07255 [Scytonematopsis contorta HA4267-MV1]|jgi:hypothetical protein|nr:hypothetical protein [Scytonematopsis contorta HA4267-MV1]
MIPEFADNGHLPVGVHWTVWEDFIERFGTTPRRVKMIDGLNLAMKQLKEAGCSTIYIDGSFVSSKESPGDYDCCWEDDGVNSRILKSIAPAIYNFPLMRAEQKIKYRGEIFPSSFPANESGTPYIDFFQFDTRTNMRKGIIAIDLVRWDYDD